MNPTEPCYLWRDGQIELWLPETPLGRIIAERLEKGGAELIRDPKKTAAHTKRT